MAKKRNIKSRKVRLENYNSKYKDVPKTDPIERIMHCLGDKLTIKKVQDIIKRKEEILSNLSYSHIKLTFYEEPINSERPRSRNMGGFISTYVPNAKENKIYLQKFLSKLKKDLKIIHTPIFIKLDIYHEMPDAVPLDEKVLFEMKLLNPATKPDWDNVSKSYTDNMIELLILDDDLIYKAQVEKFYSLLPRVELTVHFQDQFASKYVYKKIKSRKSFERLGDRIHLAKLI